MEPSKFNLIMFMILALFILPNLLGAIYNVIQDKS